MSKERTRFYLVSGDNGISLDVESLTYGDAVAMAQMPNTKLIGPFRTKAGALFYKAHRHEIGTIADAERGASAERVAFESNDALIDWKNRD